MLKALRTVSSKGQNIFKFPIRSIQGEFDRYKRMDKESKSIPLVNQLSLELNKSPLQFTKTSKLANKMIGSIPDCLKVQRECRMTTLENGIRVMTECWPGKIAAIGVIIGAGSRHETPETSGTAHFMEHLHFKVFF